MRRLTRARRDRGAAATWVALLIVPLLVVGALGIDVGLMQVDRQRLQTGADAAALAIATQCSRQVCTSTTNALAAQDMATANAPLVDPAYATVDVIDRTEGYVEVTTTSTREHFFGPVAGIDSTQLSATSGARWGFPERGTSVLPISISYCEIALALGVGVVTDLLGNVVGLDLPGNGLTRTIGSANAVTARVCLAPLLSGASQLLPQGFLFLSPEGGCGSTFVEVRVREGASPGANAPTQCQNSDFSRYLGQTVYLPIHTGVFGLGRNQKYEIYAFVAFTLEGYHLSDNPRIIANDPCPGTNNRCIRGTFELELGIGAPPNDFEFGPDAPAVGDPRVQLVLPEERP